jgi:hypothetical protein
MRGHLVDGGERKIWGGGSGFLGKEVNCREELGDELFPWFIAVYPRPPHSFRLRHSGVLGGE